MKISIVFSVLAMGLVSQACSQLPINSSENQPNYDVDKIAAVERYALRNNMQVIWINYPQARKK